MCVLLDLSNYSANAYLIPLLVCRRYILYHSGNFAVCDKDSGLSASHDSIGSHLISAFPGFLPTILHAAPNPQRRYFLRMCEGPNHTVQTSQAAHQNTVILCH